MQTVTLAALSGKITKNKKHIEVERGEWSVVSKYITLDFLDRTHNSQLTIHKI